MHDCRRCRYHWRALLCYLVLPIALLGSCAAVRELFSHMCGGRCRSNAARAKCRLYTGLHRTSTWAVKKRDRDAFRRFILNADASVMQVMPWMRWRARGIPLMLMKSRRIIALSCREKCVALCVAVTHAHGYARWLFASHPECPIQCRMMDPSAPCRCLNRHPAIRNQRENLAGGRAIVTEFDAHSTRYPALIVSVPDIEGPPSVSRPRHSPLHTIAVSTANNPAWQLNCLVAAATHDAIRRDSRYSFRRNHGRTDASRSRHAATFGHGARRNGGQNIGELHT